MAAVPFAVLWAPILLGQLHNGATDWMPKFRPGMLTLSLFDYYGPAAAAALFAILVAGLLAGGGEHPRLPARVRSLAVIFGVSVAAPLLVSIAKPIYWPGRYTISSAARSSGSSGVCVAGHYPPAFAGRGLHRAAGLSGGDHVANRASVPESTLPAGQSDKTTAEFLLRRAAAGDAIVFTSLTRAVADYYFRRAGAAGRFVEINFPAEVAAHFGWMSVALTPDRRSHLESESALTCAALERVAAGGGTVWVYDGYAPAITEILKRKLDRALTLHNRYALQGDFHTSLLEYGPAGETSREEGMRN